MHQNLPFTLFLLSATLRRRVKEKRNQIRALSVVKVLLDQFLIDSHIGQNKRQVQENLDIHKVDELV